MRCRIGPHRKMKINMNTLSISMIEQFSYTDKGPRNDNQDSLEIKLLNETLLSCLADGVSGKDCGKKASSETIKFFLDNFQLGTSMEEIVKLSHQHIKTLQEEKKECSGMATTFTACAIEGNLLSGVHVGDSRLCLLRGNGIKQLTDDHTEVNRLVKTGRISFEDSLNYPRRNVLESAIGIRNELTIQSFTFELEVGDRILLTTDGVHNVLSKKEIRDLSKQNAGLTNFGASIKDSLDEKSLSDNVSFIVLEII
jgi:PPM family protein phosphatase